jgi:general secretion pathway protein L
LAFPSKNTELHCAWHRLQLLESIAVFSRLFTFSGKFFDWWLGELAGFVPVRLRRRLTQLGQHGRLILALSPSEAALIHEQGSRLRELGRIAHRSGDPVSGDARHELAAALGRRGLSILAWRQPSVCLRLPAGDALRNLINLPLAAESNLREVVSFELDRHTPFKAQDVHFAHRVVSRIGVPPRLRVELTIMSRAAVNAALSAAQSLGFKPDSVEIAGSDPNMPPSILALQDEKPATRSFGRRLNFALGIAVLILTGVAVYLPFQTAELSAARLETQLAEVKKKTTEVSHARSEIAALGEDSMFLVNRKRRAPNVTEILSQITKVMPDETWLVEFQLSAAELQVAGFSASASDLIGFLEHTPLFRNTAFRSPVTQDPASQRERFHIAARVVSETEK